MAGMEPTRTSHARNARALLTTGITFWLRIVPRARREIRAWERRARAIPNPTLRELALAKLSKERLNPEAAACFAVLAPRPSRSRCVRLMVAYQLVYDYLDAVNEQPAYTPLAAGLRLHRALTDAVAGTGTVASYYRHHRPSEDGWYVPAFVDACQRLLRALPTCHLTPLITEAADRCGEAQSRNHATVAEGYGQLIDWSSTQSDGGDYLWWELAAAGISCLAIHALFAAASDPAMNAAEARQIDAAYFPSICAISALLDSLVDYAADAATTNHSFLAHYDSSTHAADRFTAIIEDAARHTDRLRHRKRHAIILAGLASFYLSAPEARVGFARPVAVRTIDSLGATTTPMLAVMRLRRRALNTGLRFPAGATRGSGGGSFSSH
jgi:tetraprenyl-beta-curcumene synthase